MGEWVVLKFGGTSVSTVERWRTIANEALSRSKDGLRPLVVCSALSGVSNLLEKMVKEAPLGRHEPLLADIEARHAALAQAMKVDLEVLRPDLTELSRLALGASLTREASPRLHARMMAMGEILATKLGVAFLQSAGFNARWMDARELLVAEPEPNVPEIRRMISATCTFAHDPALRSALDQQDATILVTQGFIGRDRAGHTVLFGRGGSDTSAAYFAAKIGAVRCEIWTDVPGMYTTNPRQVPQARLLRTLDYDEAQEIASMGAKVLHPRCLPPVRAHQIPMHIRCTERPDAEGTIISSQAASTSARVKSVSSRTNLTLVSMETAAMWQQVGFLADIFACFKKHGLSIDLVSTSESNVTVSLDPTANALDPETINALLTDLSEHCHAQTIGPCAAVSLVGKNIRALMHRFGAAFEAFEEQKIYLVSQAASDLNLTFVIDESQADKLVSALHQMLFEGVPQDEVFGPTLERPATETTVIPWWKERSAELVALATESSPRYLYHVPTLDQAITELKSLSSVDRILYAMKANSNPDLLRRMEAAGLSFECVSPGELQRIFDLFPSIQTERVLFTPNFAPREDYEGALARGVRITLDNLYPLRAWPELFRGKEVLVRLDPGEGRGHHKHVHTAGTGSKFGISKDEISELVQLVQSSGAKVIGLHSHVGSGILTVDTWAQTAAFLASAAENFPDCKVLDLGGGLGIVERSGQRPLDLGALNASLRKIRDAYPRFSLWLEPGRYVVARAGVLLTRVTQVKRKGEIAWIGVDTGMNSLIRPALYGAWHEIANLSRLDQPNAVVANIVGPICESGDVLGAERALPESFEGDVVVIATAGAYGFSMASKYNLRDPAPESLLE